MKWFLLLAIYTPVNSIYEFSSSGMACYSDIATKTGCAPSIAHCYSVCITIPKGDEMKSCSSWLMKWVARCK